MKVVSAADMQYIEEKAYQEGFCPEDLMDRAALGVASFIRRYIFKNKLSNAVNVFCGKGNNGGDAYEVARLLLEGGYNIRVFQLFAEENKASRLLEKKRKAFIDCSGEVIDLKDTSQIELLEGGLILDGILGTGFRGEAEGFLAEVIEYINRQHEVVISLDIPSGLNGSSGRASIKTVRADITLYLGFPKQGFYIRDGWDYIGQVRGVDLCLEDRYLEGVKISLEVIEKDVMRDLLPVMKASSHKYTRGYVVGMAGSSGMMGAAFLAGKAALHTGAGIVRVLYPDNARAEVGQKPWELLATSYGDSLAEHCKKASSFFIGPGIGQSRESKDVLYDILAFNEKPLVLDADALNIISKCDDINIPEGSIMTPHFGEMMRLLGRPDDRPEIDLNFLRECYRYSEKKKVVLILKGGPSYIFIPGDKIYVNGQGNSGMSTAGSGDVLTGVLAALLAQGLSSEKAALLGVYLHSIAGDIASVKHTSYSMVASHIINCLEDAFKSLAYPLKGSHSLF